MTQEIVGVRSGGSFLDSRRQGCRREAPMNGFTAGPEKNPLSACGIEIR